MEIGINLGCCKELSVYDEIDLMKENGFKKTFCDASREDTEEAISAVQKAGLVFENLHAQLGDINDMWKEDESGDIMLGKLCGNIRLCRKFQIPTVIVHLSAGRPAPEITDAGRARYDALMECSRENGVKIAFENSRAVANLAMALEKYDDAGFCWDVGHEVCFTPGMDYMPYFGHKLAAVHIHDNYGILDGDAHMIPFDGVNNMNKVARELARVRYEKCIMLEVFKETEFQQGKYNGVSPEEFYKRAADAANRLESMVMKNIRECGI